MTNPDQPVSDIECEIIINAPRSVVWNILVGSETTPQWLGCLEYTGKSGSRFYMQPDPDKRRTGDLDGATHCEIETLNAPECFVFSWYFPDTPKTYVRIDLAAMDPITTRVRLKHFGWDQFPADIIRHVRDGLAGGWESAVLPALKRRVEQQDDTQVT